MTQPAAEQPRRIPLDELTSDQLDQLYARLEHWEGAARKNGELYAAAENQRDDARTRAEQADATIQHLREQHIKIIRERIKTSMAETAGWKAAWQIAHDRSAKHRERADRAEKRITLARAEAQEWHAHFLDSGDAPATHALAMVLLLLDQLPPTD